MLEADGFAKQEGVHFHSRYRFETSHMHVTWRVTRDRTDPLSAEAMLPSWGQAVLNVMLRNGQQVKLGDPPNRPRVDLAAVRWFYIDGGGAESGYVAVPRVFPPGSFAYPLRISRQNSNPRPGPSVAVRLAPPSRWHELSCTIAIAPARTAEQAAAAAALLGA